MRALFLTVVLSLALLAPAAAWGQTPTDDIYDPADKRTGQDAGDSGDGNTAKAGTLPFSGSEVLLVVLAGSAVLGTGIVIRRASRSDS